MNAQTRKHSPKLKKKCLTGNKRLNSKTITKTKNQTFKLESKPLN